MLSVQQSLQHLRNNNAKAPYLQTTSKQVNTANYSKISPLARDAPLHLHGAACCFVQNHIVERMWCEINSRINYPIKAVLVELMEAGEIDIDNSLHVFCVSWFTVKVAFVGINLFFKSWNNHPIPGN